MKCQKWSPLEEVEIQTPITKTVQKQLSGKNWQLFQSATLGIGMIDGLLSLVPATKVGHIGMYRDEETLRTGWVLSCVEDIDQRRIL